MECWIEPYTPSRFACQFGYDQLYVGNANPELSTQGTLLEGARAWFYSIAGGTGALFPNPSSRPKLLCSLNFCCLFLMAINIEVPSLFLTGLGEGGTGAPMEASSVGAEASRGKMPTDLSPDPAISTLPSRTRLPRGRYHVWKMIVSKRRRSPRP